MSAAEIEAGEMKDFQDRGIGEKPFQVRRVVVPGAICTTSAEPSPGENCTTQSRSRFGSSPMVSVSIATDPLR